MLLASKLYATKLKRRPQLKRQLKRQPCYWQVNYMQHVKEATTAKEATKEATVLLASKLYVTKLKRQSQ